MPNRDLLSLLNLTGLAKENNSLYQLLSSLIASDSGIVGGTGNITVIECDTRLVAVTIYLITAIKSGQFYIVKDLYGNAFANNITLTGTVDGVANPVINTDYGIFRLYNSTNGYMTW